MSEEEMLCRLEAARKCIAAAERAIVQSMFVRLDVSRQIADSATIRKSC